ncbi:GNAT family N-acetyltransferase [Caenispirillum bisanense]|uniref:Diamine N-acetyltransferase n=1 Tax=Caenispirillum bisanense TaxID=414052 RepID=A0A286H0K5_9PROT|nr:GNAT family N-acetyltransferase [Caenispirillum bisanense]SOE01328.1 diamine N-acetyltransferase [Caenispirillum bisanense]
MGQGTTAAVTLHRVDDTCRADVLGLRVTAGQDGFVTGVAAALEEAAAVPECVPRAVRDGAGRVVGFVMYALDRNEHAPWIYRILVDAAWQGRGFGRAAMEAAVAEIAAAWPLQPRVYLGVRPDNTGAVAFYGACGFRPNGRTIGGERVLWRSLPP